MQKYASIQEMQIGEIFYVESKEGRRANDKFFGPDGEIPGDNEKYFIRQFKLNMSFDEYIKNSKWKND